MNEIATAILFLASASAFTGDCTADNTGAEKIAVAPDVRPTDDASCRIVGAGELGGLRGLEFVDVRPQPARQSVTGARVLSIAQLAERPVPVGTTRVLLGNGLNDPQIAELCTPQIARTTVVLGGGVKSWDAEIRNDDKGRRLGTGAYSMVSVAEALGSGASLAVDVRRDADLAALLKAIKHPFVDSGSTHAHDQSPVVFVDADQWPDAAGQGAHLSYYLVGGADALRDELLHGKTRAESAGFSLKRPCYLP